MSLVRFSTARALTETFPKAVTGLQTEPTDDPPTAFVQKLAAEGKLQDAVTFCAYLLPRREAVWWACNCARSLLGDIPQSEAAGLQVAEAWVHEPDEKHRLAALAIGKAGDSNRPFAWLALAAGWSGGVLAPHPQRPVPVPHYMTARAARIAVILCVGSLKTDARLPGLRACVANGVKLAESEL